MPALAALCRALQARERNYWVFLPFRSRCMIGDLGEGVPAAASENRQCHAASAARLQPRRRLERANAISADPTRNRNASAIRLFRLMMISRTQMPAEESRTEGAAAL